MPAVRLPLSLVLRVSFPRDRLWPPPAAALLDVDARPATCALNAGHDTWPRLTNYSRRGTLTNPTVLDFARSSTALFTSLFTTRWATALAERCVTCSSASLVHCSPCCSPHFFSRASSHPTHHFLYALAVVDSCALPSLRVCAHHHRRRSRPMIYSRHRLVCRDLFGSTTDLRPAPSRGAWFLARHLSPPSAPASSPLAYIATSFHIYSAGSFHDLSSA